MGAEFGYITVAAANSATLPWRSIYAEPLDRRRAVSSDTLTDQRQIDICLNCPCPVCTNCMDNWKSIRSIGYGQNSAKRRKSRK